MSLVVAGVITRLALALALPTRPISDFRALVDFAIGLRDGGLMAGAGWRWDLLNAGLPTLLSAVLRLAPGPPDTVARITTAVWTGLVPVTAFALLHGIVSLRIRVGAALLLALWPGQIAFSGVVAQDNWVLLPTVASACLAIRALRSGRGQPVAAAAVWALAAFIRQEMLVVLLPAAIVAAAAGSRGRPRWGRLAAFAASALILFGAIAAQRGAATGRFALTTVHGGTSLLGSYVPGFGLDWTDPSVYVTTVDPSLRDDPVMLRRAALRIAIGEIRLRPMFHVAKRAAALVTAWRRADSESLYFAFWHPDAGVDLGRRGKLLAGRLGSLAGVELGVIHALFLAALLLAALDRRRDLLLVGGTAGLKMALHAVIVTQARFFIPVVALEMLTIALAVEIVPRRRVAAGIALAATALAAGAMFRASDVLARWVDLHEHDLQRTYRFQLRAAPGGPTVRCVVDRGWISEIAAGSARLELSRRDPRPGDVARARCTLDPEHKGSALTAAVLDDYVPGGLPDRVVQRIEVDGREVLRHDLAALPGAGWHAVALASAGRDAPREITFEIRAVDPDPGMAWRAVAHTSFRLQTELPQ